MTKQPFLYTLQTKLLGITMDTAIGLFTFATILCLILAFDPTTDTIDKRRLAQLILIFLLIGSILWIEKDKKRVSTKRTNALTIRMIQ